MVLYYRVTGWETGKNDLAKNSGPMCLKEDVGCMVMLLQTAIPGCTVYFPVILLIVVLNVSSEPFTFQMRNKVLQFISA